MIAPKATVRSRHIDNAAMRLFVIACGVGLASAVLLSNRA
jgi:hypothetical protein